MNLLHHKLQYTGSYTLNWRLKVSMIQVTDAAVKRIQQAMADEGIASGGLRVGVKAGGCSGFSYVFRWESKPKATIKFLTLVVERRYSLTRKVTSI